MNWPLVVAVIFNLTFSTLGDICAKMWGVSNSMYWFWIGLGVNIFTIIGFMTVVKLGGLGIATAIVLLLTLIINVSLGYLFFKEAISPVQWVGLVVGAIAILLLLDITKFLKILGR